MIEITWMIDSNGVETAHRNAPSLSQKESFLGTLLYNRAEDKWYAVFGGDYPGTDGEKFGPFASQNAARNELVKMIRNI